MNEAMKKMREADQKAEKTIDERNDAIYNQSILISKQLLQKQMQITNNNNNNNNGNNIQISLMLNVRGKPYSLSQIADNEDLIDKMTDQEYDVMFETKKNRQSFVCIYICVCVCVCVFVRFV